MNEDDHSSKSVVAVRESRREETRKIIKWQVLPSKRKRVIDFVTCKINIPQRLAECDLPARSVYNRAKSKNEKRSRPSRSNSRIFKIFDDAKCFDCKLCVKKMNLKAHVHGVTCCLIPGKIPPFRRGKTFFHV